MLVSALQSMLYSMAAEKINVFASVKESFTLTPPTYLYTWGVGGVINTARPNQVIGAYIEDSGGVTHSIDIITEGRYRSISVKGTAGRPHALFFHPKYPLADLYLYPAPQAAESLRLDSIKPFTAASSFNAVTDTIAFPSFYEEPLIYNLSVRIAPEFGKTVPAEVVAIAVNSYNRLLSLNAAQQLEPVYILVPASSPYGAGYSINTDGYR
jgi:hypothetical protein